MRKTAMVTTMIIATMLLTGLITPVFALPQAVKLGGKGTLIMTVTGAEYNARLLIFLELTDTDPPVFGGINGRIQLTAKEFKLLFQVTDWSYDQGDKQLHIEAVRDPSFTMILDGIVTTNPKNGKPQFALTGSIKDGAMNELVTLSFDALHIATRPRVNFV